ncbi:hypothetical protein ACFWGL_08690 [Streptomyces sp. NPDC060286]|uniref:hypothetical protein n=1 Tax=unclassified Streptomyces TaxID=2593676 RepID=UPI0035DF262E
MVAVRRIPGASAAAQHHPGLLARPLEGDHFEVAAQMEYAVGAQREMRRHLRLLTVVRPDLSARGLFGDHR